MDFEAAELSSAFRAGLGLALPFFIGELSAFSGLGVLLVDLLEVAGVAVAFEEVLPVAGAVAAGFAVALAATEAAGVGEVVARGVAIPIGVGEGTVALGCAVAAGVAVPIGVMDAVGAAVAVVREPPTPIVAMPWLVIWTPGPSNRD